jgi:hypothetical protein
MCARVCAVAALNFKMVSTYQRASLTYVNSVWADGTGEMDFASAMSII